MNSRILSVHEAQMTFDHQFSLFSSFGQRQLIQSFLLDEIESTNRIEAIRSTRHDIFSVITKAESTHDEKIVSIANAYRMLSESGGRNLVCAEDVRTVYDELLRGAVGKTDLPDGTLFRKKDVCITDGIKDIHTGMQGEERIISAINEFLKLYNSSAEIYTRMLLSHFMFEMIHPFYNGNGRMGRYLISNGLYRGTGSHTAFLISRAFDKEKSKYYKAFKKAEDIHEFRCLNEYLAIMLDILQHEFVSKTELLKEKQKSIQQIRVPESFTESGKEIYHLIAEASLLSDFGISNQEVIDEAGISKRTLLYSMVTVQS